MQWSLSELHSSNRYLCTISTRMLSIKFFNPFSCSCRSVPSALHFMSTQISKSSYARTINFKKINKAVALLAMEARGGEKRYSSCSYLTSALDGGEWSASRLGRSLPPVLIGQETEWAPEPVWTQINVLFIWSLLLNMSVYHYVDVRFSTFKQLERPQVPCTLFFNFMMEGIYLTSSIVQGLPWKVYSYSVGEEIPCFYGTRRFMTLSILSWVTWIQSTPAHNLP
jgi:hypothetical protein